jgi:hypothetical protein
VPTHIYTSTQRGSFLTEGRLLALRKLVYDEDGCLELIKRVEHSHQSAHTAIAIAEGMVYIDLA